MKWSSNIPPSSYWWLPRLWVPEPDHKSTESWAVRFLIHTCNMFRSIWSLQIVGVILVLLKTCSSRFLWSGSSITHSRIQWACQSEACRLLGVIIVPVKPVWAGSCGWAIRSLQTHNKDYQSEACLQIVGSDHSFSETCLSRFLWLGNSIGPNMYIIRTINLKVGDSWGDHGFSGTCLSRLLWLGSSITPHTQWRQSDQLREFWWFEVDWAKFWWLLK